MNSISIVGLGYIGLPTAVIFAKNGWKVRGVDIQPELINSINNLTIDIKEPGLKEELVKVINSGDFIAGTEVVNSDVYIVSVSTPQNNNNEADLSNVLKAIESIIPSLKKGNVLIVESTIPPRTTVDIIAPLLERNGFLPGKDIKLAFCPERVLPGNILNELVENNRIIGGINEESTKVVSEIFSSFVKGKLLYTNASDAEMSKLMENTYRDVNIALANELVKISNTLGLNPLEVIKLSNEHPRVNIHNPGPGVGGHCIAVDPYFIIEKDLLNTRLITEARAINESMPSYIVDLISNITNPGCKVAVFGLAYKGNVDDVRNSPSFDIINNLLNKGYEVNVHDPYVKQKNTHIKLSSLNDTINNAELILILTDHKEFKNLDNINLDLMKEKKVFDTKNCLESYIGFDFKYDFENINIKSGVKKILNQEKIK